MDHLKPSDVPEAPAPGQDGRAPAGAEGAGAPEADLEDRRLMLAVAGGSEAAFVALIDRHQRALLNLFRRLGADQGEAEDAAQETLLRLYRYRDRYRPDARFRTFLFTLARHAWLDFCRKRERWRRSEQGRMEDGTGAGSGVSHGDRLDLEAALATLPDGHRMVLVLSVYEGLPYEEVAHVLGIPEGTVKSRVFHALRKLRQKLVRNAVAR